MWQIIDTYRRFATPISHLGPARSGYPLKGVSDMKKRQLPKLGALALAIPLVLAACGGADDSSPSGDTSEDQQTSEEEEVPSPDGADLTLRVLDYYTAEPDNTFYQELLDQCGAEVGVSIEREAVPGDQIIQRVLQQASSATLPDLLMLDNPNLQEIAASGALAPLSQFDISADGFLPGVVSASTYEGELYGLQPITNSIALFYNEDMLQDAGVEPPETWDDLRDAASQLTDGDRYGIAFSAKADYEGTWQFLPFMWSNGGNEDDIATPEVAEALQLYLDLIESGSASQSVVNWGQADVNDQFMAGQAAMMINGPWQFPVLDQDPDLNWSVVPIPTPEAGAEVVSPLGGETWTVPDTGDMAKMSAAAEVIKCMNEDDTQLDLASKRQTVPTKIALLEEFVELNPRMAGFTEVVQTARARTGLIGTEWPAAGARIYEAIGSSIAGGVDPETALEQAQGS